MHWYFGWNSRRFDFYQRLTKASFITITSILLHQYYFLGSAVVGSAIGNVFPGNTLNAYIVVWTYGMFTCCPEDDSNHTI